MVLGRGPFFCDFWVSVAPGWLVGALGGWGVGWRGGRG